MSLLNLESGNNPVSLGNGTPMAPSSLAMLNKKKALKKIFEKKFCGFQFSVPDENQSLLGMLYHSRVPQTDVNSLFDNDEGNSNINHTEMSASLVSNFSNDSDGTDDDEVEVEAHSMNPRQQLAFTVKNWSRTPENDRNILEEGAVHALIALTSTDDPLIKKWCALALYNLSTRQSNRKHLLSLGAAGGIIAVANNTRNFKSAKLCAMTLCNLSIEPGCEETLLGEHAQLSLVSFLSVRGHYLLPICAQALYNLTHVSRFSSSLERVIKALLNLPLLPGFFDPTILLLKSIVNCTRFPELHVRILEDSCLPAFLTGLHVLSNKTPELAFQLCTFIRALSETEKRRMELILRGPAKLLSEYNEFCDVEGRRQLIKAMSNMVDCPIVFQPKTEITQLTLLLDICTYSMRITEDKVVIQHGVYCISALTRIQAIDGSTKFWPFCSLDCTARVIDVLHKCLISTDAVTQYYAVLTCSNIFFNDIGFFLFEKVEDLVETFIASIYSMRDFYTTEAMASTVGSLTNSALYMDVMLRQGAVLNVLDFMMDLLDTHKDALSVQEACCVAIVCICAHASISFDETRRARISKVFYYLSQSNEPTLLYSILSGILVLADKGVTEILSSQNLSRVTEIAQMFQNLDDLTQLCCAILRLYSVQVDFRAALCEDNVLDFLFMKATCEDPVSKELAAVVLCNLTTHEQSCSRIVQRGLIPLLPALSCTDPAVQDIYVRCMCNISSFQASKQLMLKADIPQTILMIALVRSVSNNTKQFCLRVLLNMLDADTIPYYVQSNVVRAFSGLASVSDAFIQAQCAKGFLVMTSTKEGRLEIAMRKTVLMSLFGLLQSPDISIKNMTGIAIYNLLACESCWESVALSGAISLIKLIITADSDILREASAQIIITLAERPSLHAFLVREPLVHMMVEILQRPAVFAFEAAICSLASLSHHADFRHLLVQNDCAMVLLAALMSGNVNTKPIAEEVMRCLYLLSFEREDALNIIDKGHVMLSMHIINKHRLSSPEVARMMTFILRNLSYNVQARDTLVEEDALSLLLSLLELYPNSKHVIFSALSHFLFNLSKESTLHDKLMQSKLMDVVRMMVPRPSEGANEKLFVPEDVLRICAAVNALSNTPSCHQKILDGNAIDTFSALLSSLPDSDMTSAIENEIANCICNITSTPDCREMLNKHGATHLLLLLSTRSAVPDTQKFCSIALSRLSESNQVEEGVVSSLLVLSLKMDERETLAQDSIAASDSAGSVHSNANTASRRRRSTLNAPKEKHKSNFHDSIMAGLQSTREMPSVNMERKKLGQVSTRGSESVLLFDDVLEEEEDAEQEKYQGEYSCYFYSIVCDSTWIEAGGFCDSKAFDLASPSMSGSKNFTSIDRKAELFEIPMTLAPLAKESKNAELPQFAQDDADGYHSASLDESTSDSLAATDQNVVFS